MVFQREKKSFFIFFTFYFFFPILCIFVRSLEMSAFFSLTVMYGEHLRGNDHIVSVRSALT